MEVRAAMLPSHLNAGSHIVSTNDKLEGPAVIMGAKGYAVDLGPQRAENSAGESQDGFDSL